MYIKTTMTIVSKRRFGFTSGSLYRRREPHALKYLSERATFWIAVLSVFAFVTGNMVGQHGWHVFWKSVMGEGSDSMIVFTGMTPPIAQVPDYDRWAQLGGNIRTHTFRQVPRDLLIPLPRYVHHDENVNDVSLRKFFYVQHLGTYETGRGKGSHVGEDISVPEGTPVLSVANGIVHAVSNQPGGYGQYVVIRHPNVPNVENIGRKSTVYSIYAHLSSALVTPGSVVQKGDQIALSGQTGYATAPHLHFQMDLDSAPYHPYWPFTSADEREARLNFSQAIDAGLKRENGVRHTIDPMLTVQAYESFVGPTIVQVGGSSSSASSRVRLSTLEQRRQARLARLPVTTTLVAFTDNAPIVPIPAPVVSVPTSASSSSAAPVLVLPVTPAPPIGQVANIRIVHDGSFSRGWETLTLMLLDADGNVVPSPTEKKTIYLTMAFGSAEFKTPTITFADFRKGILKVEMLPHAEKTIIIKAQPFGDVSLPMKFVRN